MVFINFRIDRPRQLSKAFVLPEFENTANIVGFDPYAVKYTKRHTDDLHVSKQKPFTRTRILKDLFFVSMTEYEKNLPVNIAFPPQLVENPIGQIVSRHDYRQLRVSESEKERFVTYYFNGLREEVFPGEDRAIIPSPKVPTYDKKPQMSAPEITSRLISEISGAKYDLIVINFANADMVSHTGNIKATIEACDVVDKCIGQLTQAVLSAGGAMIITADHGNAEEMINLSTQGPDTEHNANPVPFIVVGKDYKTGAQIPQGILADVGPTILHLLQIPVPINITGRNLLS